MSLKAFVQLFAEKFLVSKKESVQDWTNLKNSAAVEIPIPTSTAAFTYVAPSNGIVQLECCYGAEDGYNVDIRVNGLINAPRIYFGKLVGWSVLSIRVAKGDKVVITYSKRDARDVCRFIPFN